MPDRPEPLALELESLKARLSTIEAKFEKLTVGEPGKAGVITVMDGTRAGIGIFMSGNGKETSTELNLAHNVDAAILEVAGGITAGGYGHAGRINVVADNLLQPTIRLDGSNGDVTVGGNGTDGDLIIKNAEGNEVARISSEDASVSVTVGGNGIGGTLTIKDEQGNEVARIDSSGTISAGASGVRGYVQVNNDQGSRNISLRGGEYGSSALVSIGDSGQAGALLINNDAGDVAIGLRAGGLAGQDASVVVGRNGQAGEITLLHNSGSDGIRLSGLDHLIRLGGVLIDGQNRHILMHNAQGEPAINLSGDDGDIVLLNADCAEEFDVAATAAGIEPGTVMVLDHDGKLRPSDAAYDPCVAGVVSGAGAYKPGIILDRQQATTERVPVALVGKVYCKVNADYGTIQVGDLLTTSPTSGHAMKVSDPRRAFGAVLGKALRPLEIGQALIPVLVALQ